MKLLLQADIADLGYYGDVVEVKAGYARNYLLPQGLAIQPTDSNVKAIEQERARRAEERRLARAELEKAAGKVEGARITLTVKANEQGHLFGSVTEEDIATSLRDSGFEVQTKQVILHEHIRQVGEHTVSLRYAEDLKVGVTVVISAEGQPEDVSEVQAVDEAGEPVEASEDE